MRFDRAHGKKQPRGDVFVAQALGDERPYFLFAGAENDPLDVGSDPSQA